METVGRTGQVRAAPGCSGQSPGSPYGTEPRGQQHLPQNSLVLASPVSWCCFLGLAPNETTSKSLPPVLLSQACRPRPRYTECPLSPGSSGSELSASGSLFTSSSGLDQRAALGAGEVPSPEQPRQLFLGSFSLILSCLHLFLCC